MDSFYGGKQGISFVIKDSFISIAAMETAFTDPTYDKAWYGEYVIIDTINKNDIDNGKVFRRTAYRGLAVSSTNSNEEEDKGTAHAEYIGQVVGPAGGIPNIEITDLETLQTNFHSLSEFGNMPSGSNVFYSNEDKSITSTATVTAGDTIGKISVIPNSFLKSGREYLTANDQGEIIGSSEPQFKYGFYTFQGNTKEQDGTFPLAITKIGFEIPYLDFDFDSAVDALPYTESTGSVKQMTITEAPGQNEFYRKYKLSIPRGVPGAYFSDFTVLTSVQHTDLFYTVEDIDLSKNQIKEDVGPHTYPTSSKIMVGKYYYYNSDDNEYIPLSQDNTHIRFYLWDIHDISDINLVTDKNAIGQSDASNGYGGYQIKFTDDAATTIKGNFNPLRKVEPILAYYDNDIFQPYYKLQGYYGNSEDAIDLGAVAPPYFGVWAQKLIIDETVSATNPPTVKVDDEFTPSGDIENIAYSAGNLGVLSYEGSSYFYMWVPDEWTDPLSFGQWIYMGATEQSEINLNIIGSNYFNAKDSMYPLTLGNRNAPESTVTPGVISIYGDAPWK